MEEGQAYAMRKLCSHFSSNPSLQNIDVMNVSGMCRNCLSKWYLAGCISLNINATYEDACEAIYGISYGEWKSLHQQKASKAQLDMFQNHIEFHAVHSKVPEVQNGQLLKDVIDRTPIEAFVFRKLVEHFQTNTCVQNIDVMNVAGFCRNCLSKWLHMGIQGISYEEACYVVYGMSYADWKTRFQTKASQEQLELFKTSHSCHAKFEKVIVKSDVCCESINKVDMVHRILVIPVKEATEVVLGILTVSDRAYNGVYADESGPEIDDCLKEFARIPNTVSIKSVHKRLVPDDRELISDALKDLSSICNMVFSTGGTGFSARDITPEATLDIVQREVRGIPEAMRRETAKHEPLAILSRAVAGIRNDTTLIVNLPGRPAACREWLAVVLPVIPHALSNLLK